MTKQRIELLCEARALIEKALTHRCTTQDEFHDLYQIVHKIDHVKSDWEWLAYEGKQVAAIKRAERRDAAQPSQRFRSSTVKRLGSR
jgi:hypothetical protein